MPITQMVSEETYLNNPAAVRIVTNYPGHEAGLHHSCDCPHYNQHRFEAGIAALHSTCLIGWDKCRILKPLYMATTHVGVVLSVGEYNGRDDSDFYADVWEDQKIVRITYASTRGWSYPNSASVDATNTAKAAADQFIAALQAERQAQTQATNKQKEMLLAAKQAKLNQQEQRIALMKNKNVVVLYKSKQETGKLFWIGPSKTKDSLRVGVRQPDGFIIWASADKVIALAD